MDFLPYQSETACVIWLVCTAVFFKDLYITGSIDMQIMSLKKKKKKDIYD